MGELWRYVRRILELEYDKTAHPQSKACLVFRGETNKCQVYSLFHTVMIGQTLWEPLGELPK